MHLPREHGAWGILLIPFATAAAIAGVFNAPVALLLASVLSFYLARTSFLKGDYRWMAGLCGFRRKVARRFGDRLPLNPDHGCQ